MAQSAAFGSGWSGIRLIQLAHEAADLKALAAPVMMEILARGRGDKRADKLRRLLVRFGRPIRHAVSAGGCGVPALSSDGFAAAHVAGVPASDSARTARLPWVVAGVSAARKSSKA
jgi:hypothetical protein